MIRKLIIFAVGMGVNSFISIMLSMIFRCVVLTASHFPKSLAYAMCLGGALIPTAMTISLWDIKCSHDPEENERFTKGAVKNLENYKVVVGCDITQPSIMLGIFCASLLLIPVYGVMYYCRWRILKFIDRPTTCISSSVTYNNVRRLVRALTVQSIVPLFTIFPASLAYTTTQFGLLQTDAYSYFIISALSSSCCIDPIVTIFYVLPFRRFTLLLFKGYDEERVSLYSGDRSRSRSRSSFM
ncbi:hypothetical protein WR25_26825 isoform B [Diploscapter pachys]|uniref:G-protein coupled receptors family 1 profile domain-containing protein n=1 Tax=Diploscapter pachys TaxID=2018661 RepID=A0A2A2KL27_9BILA|nr:hypothetical protein WR25_26825 isoform B [Diploscapter pachys]